MSELKKWIRTARPLLRGLGVLLLACGGHGLPVAFGGLINTWDFGGAAGQTLHDVSAEGPGLGGPTRTWDVAIPGVVTTGTALRLRNTGIGGSGTRAAFADLATPVSGGSLSVEVEMNGWTGSSDSAASPRLAVDMIRGNDFSVAGVVVERMGALLRVGATRDDRSDGSLVESPAFLTGEHGGEPVTLGCSVDLETGLVRIGVRSADASVFTLLHEGAIDSEGGPVHSLRFRVQDDFTLGGGEAAFLDVGSIRLSAAALPFSASGGFALWKEAFGLESLPPDATLSDDGIGLLLKYALGLDPRDPVPPSGLPRITQGAGELAFSFRPVPRADLIYRVDASLDLTHWAPVWSAEGLQAFAGDVEVPLSLTSGAAFFQLRVSLRDELSD